MVTKSLSYSILLDARERAGLRQRAVAQRAGTAQSVVARIERGATSPTTNTLQRLLEAAGFELRMSLVPKLVLDPGELDDVPRILALSPQQRLREVANIDRFLAASLRV